MTIEDLIRMLAESADMPKTPEEALEYISRDPACQSTIEELAFKQTIINILIASGLVTENDFNASINHFKGAFAQEFAEHLMARLGHPEIKINVNVEDPNIQHAPEVNQEDVSLEDDSFWETNDDKMGKA